MDETINNGTNMVPNADTPETATQGRNKDDLSLNTTESATESTTEVGQTDSNDIGPRIVIVTGGASGIGLACVKKFLSLGDKVVIADIDADGGHTAVERLGLGEDRVIFVQCDVADKLAVHNLIAQALTAFGHIDVLVNNAGIFAKGGSLDLRLKDFDRVLAVNLRGAFLVSRAVAQNMVQYLNENDDRSGCNRGRFSIVNMSSINAQVAIPDMLAYAVSKGGLSQLTRAMALELAPYGIRVNSVGPGSIKTNMLAGVSENQAALDVIHSRTPLGRIGQPSEIANIVAFLASVEASYITGENITADGGRMALNYIMASKEIADPE